MAKIKDISKEYVLGTGRDELIRLGIQHRVWADAAVQSWRRAGIGPESTVLDLGCGPGYATFDMAQLVSGTGRVVAFDESRNFVDYLKRQADARHLTNLEAWTGDAQNLQKSFKESSIFDAVYCRWVLCWLEKPQASLRGIHHILKKGGRLIIHDYFNWKTMAAGPRSAAIEKMVLAAEKSFLERNGNVDIAASLPKMLRQTGFRVSHFDVHQRVARGGGLDSTLIWILTWWRSYGPKLVQAGLLSKKDFETAARDLDSLEKDPDRFFFCPPLFEFIAEKV